MLNFELSEISEVKEAAFLDITPSDCVAMFERTIDSFVVEISPQEAHRSFTWNRLLFSPKIKMRPCKDDLFGKNYQNNQLL